MSTKSKGTITTDRMPFIGESVQGAFASSDPLTDLFTMPIILTSPVTDKVFDKRQDCWTVITKSGSTYHVVVEAS